MVDIENLKFNLGYVITRKQGTVEELEKIIGRSAKESFSSVEFIKLGYYKWSKLKLADEYYKDLYGYFSYLYQIVKFKLKGK